MITEREILIFQIDFFIFIFRDFYPQQMNTNIYDN